MTRTILIFATALSLAACGSDPFRDIYEGIKSRNDAQRTPTERAVSPTPTYDEYRKEREQKK